MDERELADLTERVRKYGYDLEVIDGEPRVVEVKKTIWAAGEKGVRQWLAWSEGPDVQQPPDSREYAELSRYLDDLTREAAE